MSSTPRKPRATRRDKQTEVSPAQTLGRLTRFQVQGLLGQFKHDFILDPDQPTILTGANGTGKSTILRIIHAVGSGAWPALVSLPFRSASLHFEHGPALRVEKGKEHLKVSQGSNPPHRFPLALFEEFAHETENRQRYLLGQRNRAAHFAASDVSAADLVRAERRAMLRRRDMEMLDASAVPPWLAEITDGFEVRLIHDKRLVSRGSRQRMRRRPQERIEAEIPEVVAQYSDELGREITLQLRRYAAASQREDRLFPQAVANAIVSRQPGSRAEIIKLIEQVGQKRMALERVGLAETEQAPRFDESSLEDPAVRVVIETFADVTLRKFAVLEEYRSHLELFIDFLNDRFLGKLAQTRPEEGLRFVLPDEAELGPTSLSSGEQQMLVLAYEILFETPRGTLLLIDEPEISLHVGWQRTFVDDIAALGRPRGISFLLASHSPSLIGGREELKRSLDQGSQ